MKFDKRNRRRTRKERIKMRLGVDAHRSFMKMEKARGIQPLCRKCALECKVLNGRNATFECYDFVKIK